MFTISIFQNIEIDKTTKYIQNVMKLDDIVTGKFHYTEPVNCEKNYNKLQSER